MFGGGEARSPLRTHCGFHCCQLIIQAHPPVNRHLASGMTSHLNPTDEPFCDWHMGQAVRQEAVGVSVRKLSRATMRGIKSRRVDSSIISPTPRHNCLGMNDITPRVNGARMNDYIGRPVRLICKVTKVRVFLHSRRTWNQPHPSPSPIRSWGTPLSWKLRMVPLLRWQ